jgi:hypothetical protein
LPLTCDPFQKKWPRIVSKRRGRSTETVGHAVEHRCRPATYDRTGCPFY